MSLRLYEDHLPIQLEYFVESAQNKIEFLREAEQVARERTAVDVLFKNALIGISKVVDKFEKPLDTSKGDIKRVVGNKELLATINKLTKEYDSESKDISSLPINNWELDEFVSLARKTYLYTSNLAKEFATGYRESNMLIMNYYKALVSNLFALVGECVAYTVSGEKVDYRSLRVITLRDFIIAYENDGIQKFMDTSKSLMEAFLDDSDKSLVLYESYDIVQSGVKFIKKFINNADRDGQIGNIVYKAIDFMKQILVIKQMVWPLVVNMLPKMNDYISLFNSFVGGAETVGDMGSTSKIATQILANSARADDKANYLISIENDQMYSKIQKNWTDKKSTTDTIDDFKF